MHETTLAGAPALICGAPAAPVLLVYHGLGVSKETHRPELERFASAGFRAIGIDAVGHGRRRYPDFESRFAGSQQETALAMIDAAQESVREIPAILDALHVDHAAIFGISFGAFIAYGAVVAEPRITTAVAMLGSPDWPKGDSPSNHLDRFSSTALLSITAEKDEHVPPGPARELHRRLDPHRHRYYELRDAVHLMGEAHWREAIQEAEQWLRKNRLP